MLDTKIPLRPEIKACFHQAGRTVSGPGGDGGVTGEKGDKDCNDT